jgi:hypothetical protein
MQIRLKTLIYLCTLFSSPLLAQNVPEILEGFISEDVVVDLRAPSYSDGILTGDDGGVVSSTNLRIQAEHFVYEKRTDEDGKQIFRVHAEGDLMVEFYDWIFVGESFDYDFIEEHGDIYDGRSAYQSWYFGGKNIELMQDGSYVIHDGFVTTSENLNTEWSIVSPYITIFKNALLSARDIQVRLFKLPIFWFPTYRINLNKNWHIPVKYRARWGGRLGLRAGFTYRLFEYNGWEGSLLFDYSSKRGVGGGFEMGYNDCESSQELYINNYFANDPSPYDESVTKRYRYFGKYREALTDEVDVMLTYDKLSDEFMATDYEQEGIDSSAIHPTELLVRHKSEHWITSLYGHFRLNDYQTIKQELPTISFITRPYNIFCSGIIGETSTRASVLNFTYDKDLTVDNFHANRVELKQLIYYSLHLPYFSVTPEMGFTGIYYSSGPKKQSVTQFVSIGKLHVSSSFHRQYDCAKHTIKPYTTYQYADTSSKPIDETYLFDLDDGLTSINQIRFGCEHTIYKQDVCNGSARLLFTGDFYTYAFIEEKEIPKAIPKGYSHFTWFVTDSNSLGFSGAWDFFHGRADHVNIYYGYTFNEDVAFEIEMRQRNPFSWRKVDSDNFFMESFHSEDALLDSTVSDQRCTLLSSLFWRIDPWWSWEWKSRLGWNRLEEPGFHEYQIDLNRALRGGWTIKASYQHKENDSRIALYLNFDNQAPKECADPHPRLYYGNY